MLTAKELKLKIAVLEDIIEAKEAAGGIAIREKAFLKSWRTYLPGGRNYRKLAPDAPE